MKDDETTNKQHYKVPQVKIPGKDLVKPIALTKEQLRIIKDRLAIETAYYEKFK